MENINIEQRYKEVKNLLKNNRLREALFELKNMAATRALTNLYDEISRLEDSYKLMLQYAIEGVDDPNRDKLYSEFVLSADLFLDRIIRQYRVAESSKWYYNTLRNEAIYKADTLDKLMGQYEGLCNNSSLYNLITSEKNDLLEGNSLQKENLEKRIFNRLWVKFPLTVEDCVLIENAILSPQLPDYFKQLLVSALFLGLLESFDERRLDLLFTIYERGDEISSIKSLCSALIVLCVKRDYSLSAKTLNHIASIKETTLWNEDIKMIFLQLIKTRDTERINRKMQDELIPQMLKLRPDITRKLNDQTSIIDVTSMEENPEWQEMLDKSGITEKMRELTELQEEGGDVFMSTFAQLKTFPFFSDVVNWFIPFHLEHSAVVDAVGQDAVIGDILLSSPFLCNSDKYSLALSMKSIPESQRSLMMSQFNAQNINLAELRNSELLLPSKKRENIANKYVQDLYRFFKLFRRKSDFIDPFGQSLNLATVSVFADEFNNTETLSLIGEFYFKRKYYEDAYDIFKTLMSMLPPSAQLFQKLGYCCQQNGDIKNALKYYEQSELLNSDNIWTLRRIASCYKLLNNTRKALEYYQRLDFIKSDDLSVTFNMGHCLMELERFDEALKCYYKVEFLGENSIKAWRAIAWCAFLSGDYEQSEKYYTKIMNDEFIDDDYLNFGHLYLVKGDFRQAIEYYKKYSAKVGETDKLIDSINKDRVYLEKAGVDFKLLPLVIDAVLYSLDS